MAGKITCRAVAEALGLPHTSATTFSGSEKIGHYG